MFYCKLIIFEKVVKKNIIFIIILFFVNFLVLFYKIGCEDKLVNIFKDLGQCLVWSKYYRNVNCIIIIRCQNFDLLISLEKCNGKKSEQDLQLEILDFSFGFWVIFEF